MKDIKYILKRIIIGTGIALAIMFIKQNVYAYEWTTEGDQQLSTVDYYFTRQRFKNNPYLSSRPSYPYTAQGNSDTIRNYGNNAESGTPDGSNASSSHAVGPYFINGEVYDLSGFTFEPNINYYVILAFGYSNDYYSSIANNVNEELLLDSSTYTTNNNYVNISSASFSFGTENDIEEDSNYPYIYYWKVFFTVDQEVDDLILTIGYGSNQNIVL